MSKYFLDSYIKDLRTQSGLSQKEFASAVGIGFSTLKQAELGNTSMLNEESVKALAKYLNINELEVLKNILYYGYKDYLVIDDDANALALYTCYLYQNGFKLINEKLFLNKEHKDYIYVVHEADPEYFTLAIMPMLLEDKNKDLGLKDFLGFGSSLKKNNNPVQIRIPFRSDLKLVDVITKPQVFSAYAAMIANSIHDIYRDIAYSKTKITFVFAYDEKLLKEINEQEVFIEKKDKQAIYNFVLFNTKTYKFKELYSQMRF